MLGRIARLGPLSLMRLLVGLVLVVVALQMIVPGSVAQAATDPQVLIAVDATSPDCAYLISPGNHTHSGDNAAPGTVPTTRIACPAGTVIVTATIPRSQAIANNEAYVSLLPPQASSSQQVRWNEQVHQLMQAKRRSLQAHQTVRPLTTCGYTAYLYGGYVVVFNDYLQGRVTYYLSQNCSQVYLDTAYVDAGYVPYNNLVYWYGFAYSNYTPECPPDNLFFPYTTYSYIPNVWKASGLDALFSYEVNGTFCHATGGTGNRTIDIGTLN